MTIESEYLALMPSTVTVYAKSSRDAYGKASFSGTGTSLRCRIQMDKKVTTDAENRTVTQDGTIYVYGTTTVSTDDRLVLPDGSDKLILSVETRNDESGPHHTVIRFGG